MANILTPDFKLKIGTTDFSNQPNKRRVSEMTVEQLSDGASSFRIVLDDSDEAISDGKISILEGMECTVEMGFAESGTKQVIKGYKLADSTQIYSVYKDGMGFSSSEMYDFAELYEKAEEELESLQKE